MPYSQYTDLLEQAKEHTLETGAQRQIIDADGIVIAHVKPIKKYIKAFGQEYVKILGAYVTFTSAGYERVPLPWNNRNSTPCYFGESPRSDSWERGIDRWGGELRGDYLDYLLPTRTTAWNEVERMLDGLDNSETESAQDSLEELRQSRVIPESEPVTEYTPAA